MSGNRARRSSQWGVFSPQPGRWCEMSIESVFFGLSPSSYDNGRRPSCAINASNVVVEVHKGESEDTLNWRIGGVQGVYLSWLPRPAGYKSFGNGTNPAVAIDPSNVVIVVYDDNGLR